MVSAGFEVGLAGAARKCGTTLVPAEIGEVAHQAAGVGRTARAFQPVEQHDERRALPAGSQSRSMKSPSGVVQRSRWKAGIVLLRSGQIVWLRPPGSQRGAR